MSRITQQQLESYLWGAATLLRGTIDAGDYKQFIFPLLFYKRLCDVFDEETLKALRDSGGDEDFAQFPENHRFQIPAEAHWREVRKASRDVGRALQQSIRAIETANQSKLYNIFGDAQWTNKDRLSDSMLRDLVEHFSSLELTVANLPEDELGQGYEFLIKKFADDSGHTAAEFYTNRTVVHLMTEILDVQPEESVYDPTCGSGGMLLSCIAHLRRQGKEWRNVKLYGQERNLMTSSIARMNCFLHGIEDFRIERGDTLAEPKLVEGDQLMKFDVVLANPPYSIKQWDREVFASDPWGRNLYGTPPQGRADYAFQQHILKSLNPKTGRCAVLWPHGVLFRQEEDEMRRRMIEADLVEAVIGLGPNLFYNASMESCVVVCRTSKPKERRGKILFVNAQNEIARERAQSFLTSAHIDKTIDAYKAFSKVDGYATVAALDEVRLRGHSLKIDLYVQARSVRTSSGDSLRTALKNWNTSRISVRSSLDDLLQLGTPQIRALEIAAHLLASFDRSTWKRVRFGEVVKQMKEQVNPQADGIERYVAGEHMETENVHIRKWGTVGDGYLGPAFIRGFRKGQVLYGSRRTYLKKVSVAEWDGVTANTTFVLEAVEGKMLQELLPWLMLSERFTKHSVQESKGSTNPYINYPDIAKFEFDLPPLDQQRRIAEMLWAVDRILQAWLIAEEAVETASDVFAAKAFNGVSINKAKNGTGAKRLGDVFKVHTGATPSRANSEFWGGKIAWIKTGEVNYKDIYDSEEKITPLGYEKSATKLVPKDSVLMALYGQGPTLGRVAHLRVEATVNQACAAIWPTATFNMRYLYHYLVKQYVSIRSLARGGSQPNINSVIVKDFIVPAPPLAEQGAVVENLQKYDHAHTQITYAIQQGRDLLRTFVNAAL
jgi:type I restriction enzyme M protein